MADGDHAPARAGDNSHQTNRETGLAVYGGMSNV
jgi:hypothetical protein